MPLRGYLKTSDPGRISTVANTADPKNKRKKIKPIPVAIKDMYVSMYVTDCLSHEGGGVAIPIELVRNNGQDWQSVGVAKCCPLCWKVLEPPVGVDLPPPIRLAIEEKHDKYDGMSRRLHKERKGGGRPTATTTANRILLVKSMLRERGTLTIPEVRKELGVTRVSARSYLDQMVKRKLAIKTVGAGGMSKTTYEKAP